MSITSRANYIDIEPARNRELSELRNCSTAFLWKGQSFENSGGEGGIRTPDTGVSPYNGLANRRLQPLGHLSGDFE